MPEQPKKNREARALDPFSLAVKNKKESLYSRVKIGVGGMNIIIGITAAALVVVILLIILEAAGVFSLDSFLSAAG